MSRLILLPGLGADERLCQPQLNLTERVEVPNWIAPHRNEPLTTYAKRFAAHLDTTQPFFLAGISFGGMIALELAKHLNPTAVCLIASCRSPKGVRPIFRLAGKSLLWLPPSVIGAGRHVPGAAHWIFGTQTPEQDNLLNTVLMDMDLTFVRWGMRALLAWPGVDRLDCPIRHIHGSADRLLPICKVEPDIAVEGAGHLVNLTHPQIVNENLKKWMHDLS